MVHSRFLWINYINALKRATGAQYFNQKRSLNSTTSLNVKGEMEMNVILCNNKAFSVNSIRFNGGIMLSNKA